MKIVVLIELKADFRHAGGAVVPPDDERIAQERFEDGPRLLPLLSTDLPVVIHVEGDKCLDVGAREGRLGGEATRKDLHGHGA